VFIEMPFEVDDAGADLVEYLPIGIGQASLLLVRNRRERESAYDRGVRDGTMVLLFGRELGFPEGPPESMASSGPTTGYSTRYTYL